MRGCRQYKVPANYEVHSATAGLTVLASQCHIKYDSYVNLTVIQSFKRNKLLENNYQLVSSGFVNSYKWKDVHNEVTCFCLFFSVVNIDYLSSLHFTISFYVCFDKYFLRVINVVPGSATVRILSAAVGFWANCSS